MKTLLRKLFIDHWQRKLVALILSMIIWLVVNHSISITKNIHNVPVTIKNLPPGQTAEGLQPNGRLKEGISLSLTGNKHVLENLSSKDLLVVIDAEREKDEWIAKITPKNLVCLNPSIDLIKEISKVSHSSLIVKLTNLIREKIPVIVTKPIGEPPTGYKYLDIWPYQLSIYVTGPKNLVENLKTKGLKLTLNLNNISKETLDSLYEKKNGDEISFFVPKEWKTIFLPDLSDTPIKIDDKRAKALRIDFAKKELIPLEREIPITLFFPPQYKDTLNPDTYSLNSNPFIRKQNGINLIKVPLYAGGVSPLFVDIVKDMIQIVVITTPTKENKAPLWNVQFIYPIELENRYIAQASLVNAADLSEIQPHLREEYLRNRFRSYMNRFRLYTEKNQKLHLDIKILPDTIDVRPKNIP